VEQWEFQASHHHLHVSGRMAGPPPLLHSIWYVCAYFETNVLGVIIFGLVWFLSKKITKPKFVFEKKTETGSNRPVSVRFGFFRAKTGSNRFGSVFSVLAQFFPVLARFFSVWLVFSGLARFFFRFFVGFGSVFCL
jgi:hypothetical protein